MGNVNFVVRLTVIFALVVAFVQDHSTSFLSAQETEPLSVIDENGVTPDSVTNLEEKLRKDLDRLRNKYSLPALWAGKFYADGRQIVAVSGVRKWGTDTPAMVDDVIHIGSCTKAMTAVLVAQCCSQGTLKFESTLNDIFPDVDGLSDSSWAQVTVVDLLQHHSGAPANADWASLDGEHCDDAVAARRAMLKWLIQQRRPRKPGFVYSNVGYALLGHIVETIDRAAWESLMEQRIFAPLDIKSAGFGPVCELKNSDVEPAQDEAPRHAWGHTSKSGLADFVGGLLGQPRAPEYEPQKIDNLPPLGPAGRVHLTLLDWSKFVLLFASEQGPQKMGVSSEIWSRLLEARKGGDYAGGWVLLERDWAGGRTLFHNGSNTTWYCVAFVAPGKNYCLLAATTTYSDAAFKGCDQAVATCNTLGF